MIDYTRDSNSRWRQRLHEVIFEADTAGGKAFDLTLIVCIALSIIVVMLDSIQELHDQHGSLLYAAEWVFTLLFTAEYLLRLLSVGRPLRYALSFYGIVDFLSIVPTYLSIFVPGTQYLLVIRSLRVLRIFRIFKLSQYVGEARQLTRALHSSRRKIMIFYFTVIHIVVIVGAMMYLIEGRENGFTSIPRSIYWAIVTITTVGYGDIAPQTNVGQAVAAFLMITGYAILAVPTGIVTAEWAMQNRQRIISTQSCPQCSSEGHDADAKFCKHCGADM
ncbi:MAG: ion transporter [Candidatus Latescibacterota bacterium]|nr:ion transporter [Candidatus Latescibacterota bacterium]MEE2728903.1 ion transporter [Candidatus Latescibacterota bacterium]